MRTSRICCALALCATGCIELAQSPCDPDWQPRAAPEERSCESDADLGPCLVVSVADSDGHAPYGVAIVSTPTERVVYFTIREGYPQPDRCSDETRSGAVCRAHGTSVSCEGCKNDPKDIAIAGGRAFYVSAGDGQVPSFPLDSAGEPSGTDSASPTGRASDCVAADESLSLFSHHEDGSVALAARADDAIVGQIDDRSGPRGVALRYGEIFWLEDGGATGVLLQSPIDSFGSVVPTELMILPARGRLGCLGSSERALAWAAADDDKGESLADIWVQGLDPRSGCAFPLVTGVAGLHDVALAGERIYWTSRQGIWRMRFPSWLD